MPNPAHETLVAMEMHFKDFCLVTQNIDGLHFRAGSRKVLELHGNIWRAICPTDGEIVNLPNTPLERIPPLHSCGTPLRPHVVQFGESLDPKILKTAVAVSRRAKLFLVIGTSGVVFPAAQLPLLALENGADVIEVNKHCTPLSTLVTASLCGEATKIVPAIWDHFTAC
jgi:NAD-dependent deacetylase